jgi:hypothetical protein
LARNVLNTAVTFAAKTVPARQSQLYVYVSGGWKTVMAAGICRVYLLAALVFVAAAAFFVIGALGPQHTWAHHHPVKTCIVENAFRHILDPGTALVDGTECGRVGKPMDLETEPHKQYYPLENILFHVQIPFLDGQILSRKFHFVIADLAIHFDNDFLKIVLQHDMNYVLMEVVLGYRDNHRGPWQRMAQGNITRTLRCHMTEWRYLECEHMQLFELGSVYHPQYLVNVAFPYLPLSSLPQYRGLAPLNKLALYVVHQTMAFTDLWFTLKCVLFPVSLVTLCWLLWRLAGNSSMLNLTHKSLVFMCASLTAYNAPIEMLTLYLNIPWMLVIDDFRQGLLISSLFFFWIVFVGEHTAGDRESGLRGGTLGSYWKQLVTISTSSIFMFVYEFCERGIQTVFPFYSLWSTSFGETVAYLFVGVATLSGVVYLVMFVVMVARAYRHLRDRQTNISHLSPQAQKTAQAVFSQWKCFLLLTATVAVTSISTVILPSEALVYQWQHHKNTYSIYSNLIT